MREMKTGMADAWSQPGSMGRAHEHTHVQVLLGKSVVIFSMSKRYHV